MNIPTPLMNAMLDVELIAEMSRMRRTEYVIRVREIATEHAMSDEWHAILGLFSREIGKYRAGKATSQIR